MQGKAKASGSRQTHVALLRGINVGGKNPLPMSVLVELFAGEGCSEVRTYIQSGNVLFRSSRDAAGRIGAAITERISKRFGYEIPVIVRSEPELSAVLSNNPFLGTSGAFSVDEAALHVMFLADRPASQAVGGLDPDRSPPDTFAVRGREVYLHCPNGMGRSKLTNAYFDSRLATKSTVRNWRTTLALRDLALTSSRAT